MAAIFSKAFQLFSSMPHSVPEPPLAPNPDEPAPITATRVDFAAYGLPEYAERFALVIDNLFTKEDCERLLSFVSSDDAWPEAALDEVYIDKQYRNSGRFVRDDPDTAAWILTKIKPYLHEIETLDNPSIHARLGNTHRNEKGEIVAPARARISSLRQGLRFLRYVPGEFFQRHTDTAHVSDDKSEISYYTVQIYLNGDGKELAGGATRFWPNPRLRKGRDDGVFVDVDPRIGRVLIFEQRDLMHSGEKVRKGVKYNIRADMMYTAEWGSQEQERSDGGRECEKL